MRRGASMPPRSIMVVMVVVMMMMVVTVATDHDHRFPSPMAMMVMVMMMGELRYLHIRLRVLGRRAFIDHAQRGRGVWNRLQQVGIGIGLQYVSLGRGRRPLGGA